MRILAVDNTRQRLTELEKSIKAAFTHGRVKSFVDPMMAARYGVRHSVDIIIAEKRMIHINGIEMVRVVHNFNSNIKIYLIKEADETFDGVDVSGVAGWLERPNIEEQLKAIATEQQA